MSQKCKVYIIQETGKEPELEIRMNSKYDHYDDIFTRYWGPYHWIIQRIKIPSNPKTKKTDENENEYNDNEIKINRIRIVPHFSIKLDDNHWKLYKRVYTRNWNHVCSYNHNNGRFIVDVYQKPDLGIRYLYYNEYDGEIQWYKM